MLPKWHILSGFISSYIIYWFTSLTIFQASLIFLSSVLIDFDHYLWYRFKKRDWNLKNAYIYLKRHRKIYKPLMLLHTIEFHILIALLIFVWQGFFYVLVGMLFHSIFDLIDLIYTKRLYLREFSLIHFIYTNL